MSRLSLSAVVLLVELLAIVGLYQVFVSFECRNTDVFVACRALRSGTVLAVCLAAGLGLATALLPALRTAVSRSATTPGPAARRWAAVHAAGLVLIAAPGLLLSEAALAAYAAGFLLCLAVGGLMAFLGGLFWLAPPRDWSVLLRTHRRSLVPVIGISLLIPAMSGLIGSVWDAFETIRLATFYSVAIFVALTGNTVYIDPETATIGIREFSVQVAESCSGIEGFALTTAFLAIYALLMKDDLRQGRFWLWVWPLAMFMSFLLNILRIGVLILIGGHVSPELAVNGFHSFAGWLTFTLLALAILAGVHLLPGLSRSPRRKARNRPLPPLTQDPAAAFIVPFLAFMFSSLLLHTFLRHPELGYAGQVLAMALALWVFRRPYLNLVRRLDPVALGAGAVIGLGWILTAQPGAPLAGLAGLGGAALVLWIVLRVIGTTLLVPIVEEAFFRGYLFSLIDTGGPARRVLALVVTTAGFAALHSRPLAAALAGVIFAWVMMRRGRLADAMLAHIVANALIAGAALWAADWSLI